MEDIVKTFINCIANPIYYLGAITNTVPGHAFVDSNYKSIPHIPCESDLHIPVKHLEQGHFTDKRAYTLQLYYICLEKSDESEKAHLNEAYKSLNLVLNLGLPEIITPRAFGMPVYWSRVSHSK